MIFYVNGCFLVEGVREGQSLQSLQAGTTNKRTLAWLCRRLPSASCLPLGRHLGLLLFSGACRRAAFGPAPAADIGDPFGEEQPAYDDCLATMAPLLERVAIDIESGRLVRSA